MARQQRSAERLAQLPVSAEPALQALIDPLTRAWRVSDRECGIPITTEVASAYPMTRALQRALFIAGVVLMMQLPLAGQEDNVPDGRLSQVRKEMTGFDFTQEQIEDFLRQYSDYMSGGEAEAQSRCRVPPIGIASVNIGLIQKVDSFDDLRRQIDLYIRYLPEAREKCIADAQRASMTPGKTALSIRHDAYLRAAISREFEEWYSRYETYTRISNTLGVQYAFEVDVFSSKTPLFEIEHALTMWTQSVQELPVARRLLLYTLSLTALLIHKRYSLAIVDLMVDKWLTDYRLDDGRLSIYVRPMLEYFTQWSVYRRAILEQLVQAPWPNDGYRSSFEVIEYCFNSCISLDITQDDPLRLTTLDRLQREVSWLEQKESTAYALGLVLNLLWHNDAIFPELSARYRDEMRRMSEIRSAVVAALASGELSFDAAPMLKESAHVRIAALLSISASEEIEAIDRITFLLFASAYGVVPELMVLQEILDSIAMSSPDPSQMQMNRFNAALGLCLKQSNSNHIGLFLDSIHAMDWHTNPDGLALILKAFLIRLQSPGSDEQNYLLHEFPKQFEFLVSLPSKTLHHIAQSNPSLRQALLLELEKLAGRDHRLHSVIGNDLSFLFKIHGAVLMMIASWALPEERTGVSQAIDALAHATDPWPVVAACKRLEMVVEWEPDARSQLLDLISERLQRDSTLNGWVRLTAFGGVMPPSNKDTNEYPSGTTMIKQLLQLYRHLAGLEQSIVLLNAVIGNENADRASRSEARSLLQRWSREHEP